MIVLLWASRLLALAITAGLGTVLIMGPFLAFWLLMVALVATAVVEHTAHSVLEERQRFEVWQRRISQETEWIEGRP